MADKISGDVVCVFYAGAANKSKKPDVTARVLKDNKRKESIAITRLNSMAVFKATREARKRIITLK